LSIEKQSEHPLAEAVVKHLENVEHFFNTFDSITGKGAKADYKTNTYYVGNKKLLAENNITIADQLQQADEWGEQSKTVIWFANSKQALSVIAISDKIKETSVEAIKQMQDMGIDCICLPEIMKPLQKPLQAANRHRALQSRSLPQHKADFVKELQTKAK
jgi:Cu2+-exporting ATPase